MATDLVWPNAIKQGGGLGGTRIRHNRIHGGPH
jgi:hypothetical protein